MSFLGSRKFNAELQADGTFGRQFEVTKRKFGSGQQIKLQGLNALCMAYRSGGGAHANQQVDILDDEASKLLITGATSVTLVTVRPLGTTAPFNNIALKAVEGKHEVAQGSWVVICEGELFVDGVMHDADIGVYVVYAENNPLQIEGTGLVVEFS